MSRVGKKPIPIPENTKITYKDKEITVQGKKGTLKRLLHPLMDLQVGTSALQVIKNGEDRLSRSLYGLTRTLIANMITGVNKGFDRILEIHGIGYRAEVSGKNLVLNIGYSHPVSFAIPEGITASVEKNTVVKLSGIDKELLGQTVASIRRLKPPEPYKGKGIKYAEERIQRKAGKTGTK